MNIQNLLLLQNEKLKKIESDRGRELHINNFHTFLKFNFLHHYSRFSDTGPSIAEKVNKCNRNSLNKPVFEKRIASWISDLPLVTKMYNNTFYHLTKVTPIERSKKI